MDITFPEDALHDFVNQDLKYRASIARICEKYEVLDRLGSDPELDPRIRSVLTRENNLSAHDRVPIQEGRHEGCNPSSLICSESLRPKRIVHQSSTQLDYSENLLSSEDESDESSSDDNLGCLDSIEISDISKIDDDSDTGGENSAAVDETDGGPRTDGDNSAADGKTCGGGKLANAANLSAIDLFRLNKTCITFAKLLHSQSLIISDNDERIRRARQEGKKAAMDHVDRLKECFLNRKTSSTTPDTGCKSVTSLPGCALKDVTNYVCVKQANRPSTLVDVDGQQLRPVEEPFADLSRNYTPASKENIPNSSSDSPVHLLSPQPMDKSCASFPSRQILFECSNQRHCATFKRSPVTDKSSTPCLQSSAVTVAGSKTRPADDAIVGSCSSSDDRVRLELDNSCGSAKYRSSNPNYTANKVQPSGTGSGSTVSHSSSDNIFRRPLSTQAKSSNISRTDFHMGRLEKLDPGENMSSMREVNGSVLPISSCVQPTLPNGIREDLGNVIVGSTKVLSRANFCDGSDFVENGSSLKHLVGRKPHNTTYSVVNNCPPALSAPHFPVPVIPDQFDEISSERSWQFPEENVHYFDGKTFNIDSPEERNSDDIVGQSSRISHGGCASRLVGSKPSAESFNESGNCVRGPGMVRNHRLSVLRGDTGQPEHPAKRPAEPDRCFRQNTFSVTNPTERNRLQNIDYIVDFICAAGVTEKKSMAELDAEANVALRRAVSIERGQSLNTYICCADDGYDNSENSVDYSGRHFAVQDSERRITRRNDQTYDRCSPEICNCDCSYCSTKRFQNATVGGSPRGSNVTPTSSDIEGSGDGESQSSGSGRRAFDRSLSTSCIDSDCRDRDQMHSIASSRTASDYRLCIDAPSTIVPTPDVSNLAILEASYEDAGRGGQREISIFESDRILNESSTSWQLHNSPSRSKNKQGHRGADGGTFNVPSAYVTRPVHDYCSTSKNSEVDGASALLTMPNATYGIGSTRPCTPTLNLTKPVIQLSYISKKRLQPDRSKTRDEQRKQSKCSKPNLHSNKWNGKNSIFDPKIKVLSKAGLKSDDFDLPRRFNSPRSAKHKACRNIKLTVDAGYVH